MKLRLEFEDSDFREMIQEYFDRNGFAVKNLDQLCELFKKAFPDGIKVDAETKPPIHIPSFSTSDHASASTVTAVPVDAETVEPEAPEKTNGKDETFIASASDLFDPTPGNVPSRDEQLRQSNAEVARIVAQSKALEEEKAKENQ